MECIFVCSANQIKAPAFYSDWLALMAASLQPFFLRLRHDSNIKEAEEGGSSDLFDDSPKTVVDFEEKERVLCYHGPLLYEAKVK